MIRGILLAVLLLLLQPAVHGQRYPFYNLSIEQGLIQSQAMCLAQDKAGHLWVGTLGGLSRYDGHSFTSYSVRDGLPDNTITSLDISPSGELWIGTQKGLAAYDGKAFRQYIFQSSENPQGNVVFMVRTAPDGTTWCIAGKQIYSIRKGKIQSLPMPDTFKNVTTIYAHPDGSLYAGFTPSNALYNYRRGHWESVALPPAKTPYFISRIYEDFQRQLWLLTNNGLLQITNGKIQTRHFPHTDRPVFPTCITQAHDGSYWLGANQGAFRMTDTSIRFYNKQNGFTDNGIDDALTDAEGNIWMASDGQGLFRFSGAPFTALDETSRLPSAQIMALAADDRGGLYFGTYDAGLYYYSDKGIKEITLPDRARPPVTSLVVKDNGLWIGTKGKGLYYYKNGSFKQYWAYNGTLPTYFITAMEVTPDDRLWIGTNKGAFIYEDGAFRRLAMPEVSVADFTQIDDDQMLIATQSNGLMLYNDEEVRPFITKTAIDSASPQCVAVQGDELWVGTSDNGAICHNRATGKTIVVNKTNGLRSDFVYNIYAADDGTVWAGTGFGIYNIRLKNDHEVAVTFYGRGQGVTGMESNHNAVLGMPDGSIWFGTTNGAMHYRPGAQKMATQPVSIVLQSLKLYGERIGDTSYYTATTPFYDVPIGLRLPPRKNNLTFSFQAITLSDEAGIAYRYQMAGLDAQWSDWSPTNTITYSALPPGKYTLHVQCSVNGEQVKNELIYPFEIITPFHKTTLFRLLIFGGCILLGVTLQYIANKRKQARLKMIDTLRREEQAKVRERTAEDFHDEVGNKLTRINVLTNVLKSKITELSPDANRIIDQIQDNTGQLYSGTRDILWSLKPSNDTAYEILHRIRDFGQDLFGDTDIDFVFSGTDEHWREYRLPMDVSRNLIMIFKEAMNNCLKYAQATCVTLDAAIDANDILYLQLRDNGKGFDEQEIRRGNGLNNMAIRAKRLGGTLNIASRKGQGTTLNLSFKIPQSR